MKKCYTEGRWKEYPTDNKMATSEDDLQTMAHHLNLIARKYKMTVSNTKTKSMATWGDHIQRVKNT